MDVVELQELVTWIDLYVKSPNLLDLYQKLREVLQQNAQGSTQQPIETQKNALLQAVRQPPLDVLSEQQLETLNRLEIGPCVGERAQNAVEDILYRNAIDIPTAAQRIEDMRAAVERGLAKADQIRAGLLGLVDSADREAPGVLIRVTFKQDAAIGNVVQLEDWSDRWHMIARGVALLHDKTPEDVLVLGAGRGSLVFDLSVTAAAIANSLAFILLRGLKVAERFHLVRFEAEKVRALRLRNDDYASKMEREAAEDSGRAAEDIVDELLQAHSLTRDTAGDKAAALVKSVEYMLDFLQKGGEVDPVLPPEEPAPEGEAAEETPDAAAARQIMAELRENARQARILERRVKQLEAGNPPPDEAGS